MRNITYFYRYKMLKDISVFKQNFNEDFDQIKIN